MVSPTKSNALGAWVHVTLFLEEVRMTNCTRWFALGAAAVALGACSDVVSPPTRSVTPRPSFSVTPGTNSVILASDGSTQHCTAQDVVGNWTIPATFGPFAGCGTALDLMPALAVYNPGWSSPVTGSDWIGFTSNGGPSSDYRPETGRYVFQETFNLPAGVTAPSLTLHSLSDNLVAVYLNGAQVAAQTVTDCNSGPPCNWNTANTFTASTASGFVIGGSNTVTIILVATPIGFGSLTPGIGGPAPTYGCYRVPQTFGQAGFGTPFNVPTSPAHVFAGRTMTIAANGTGCENPAGVSFQGTVSWTPPGPNHGCTLGFWKNHTGFGPQDNAWPAPYVPGVTTLGGAGFTNTGNQTATMLDALSFSGGPTVQDAKNNLMKQAVAALLNAATPGMNYPLTVAQVLSQVNAALASGDKGTILDLANTLDGFNSLEGPLC